jgi:hypothetical protein
VMRNYGSFIKNDDAPYPRSAQCEFPRVVLVTRELDADRLSDIRERAPMSWTLTCNASEIPVARTT